MTSEEWEALSTQIEQLSDQKDIELLVSYLEEKRPPNLEVLLET